jgi:DNA polymerase III subunit delta
LEKKTVFFESKKMYDDKLPGWINSYLHDRNYRISPKASALIAENIGNDLNRIANELDKLCLNLPAGREVGVDEIEKNIGISKEFNVFELQHALAKKDALKANRIINYFAANPRSNPLVLILGNLYNYFSKIMIYHQLTDKSRNNAAATLGVNAFFLKDYELAARTFPQLKLLKIMEYLRECDMKSKGVGSENAQDGELLKELVYKILH